LLDISLRRSTTNVSLEYCPPLTALSRCDAVAIIEQTEDDEDDDDADDAQSTQISALQKQVTGMMRSQKEIQKLMNHFARELYASKGLDLPLSLVGQEEDETDAHFDDREYSIPIDSNKQGSQIWKGISVLFRSPDAGKD